MLTTINMVKWDNGYKAQVLEYQKYGEFKRGEVIQNRNFKPYPKGAKLAVVFNITATGRRMVKRVDMIAKEIDSVRYEKVILEGDDGVIREAEVRPELETVDSAYPGSTTGAVTIGIPGHYEMEDMEKFDEALKRAFEKHGRFEVEEGTPIPDGYVAPTPDESEEALVRVLEKREGKMKKAKEVDKLNGYYVSDEGRLVFTTAHGMSTANPEKAVKVMMVGASGYGKTTLPKLFAELTGKRFMRMNCATIRDPEEWFGYREAREGSTVFVRSQFGREIEEGNLVVVLDEFNRLEPWLHNTLFPLLDDDGCTVVHDEEFRIGPGVIVVGTINTGYRYTGTFELDEALLNRFDFVLEVGPIPHGEEVKVLTKRTGVARSDASSIVKMANILRQSDIVCSTRTSLLIANMVQSGMNIREAYESAVVRRTPSDSGSNGLRKQVVDLINVQLGPCEPRRVVGDVFSSAKEEPVEQESIEEEVNEGHKVYEMTLQLNSSVPFMLVTAIQQLRRLPLTRGGMDYELGLSEAKGIADRIKGGETVKLNLSHKPADFDEIVTSLKGAGLTGRFVIKSA